MASSVSSPSSCSPVAKKMRTAPAGEEEGRGGAAEPPAALLFQVFDIIAAPGGRQGAADGLHLYGRTAAGQGVSLQVSGFEPYFYARLGGRLDDGGAEALGVSLARALGGGWQSVRMSPVEPSAHSLWGYRPDARDTFARVSARSAYDLSGATDVLTANKYALFESDVDLLMRFMVDKCLTAGGWVEVPATERILSACGGRRCVIEASAPHWALTCHPADAPEFVHVAPARILSFDIEVAGRAGIFPEAEHDPVIQISSVLCEHGRAAPLLRTVLVLGTCAPLGDGDATARTFSSEEELLVAWRDLVVEADPDVLTGYNITGFDFPYLFGRAKVLGVSGQFNFLGRKWGAMSSLKASTFSSNAYGTASNFDVTVHGRVVLDVLTVMRREHKLSSYSLNSVAEHFLGEKKDDVPHSQISALHAGSAQDRAVLAKYCLKDALLPQLLIQKLCIFINLTEMARVCGVPITWLLTRGQSCKVFSLILRAAKARGFLVPTRQRRTEEGGADGTEDASYQGALVLDPLVGFHDTCVATLDFSSLYPSIVRRWNLCYTTLIPVGEEGNYPAEHVTRTPEGAFFVTADLRPGLLPEILTVLTEKRKAAKAQLKEAQAAGDSARAAVLDGRQLALKVSANSVYGFTGAATGPLHCMQICASVTAFGREAILKSAELVEATYTVAKGYGFDFKVLYGDTDSLMVDLGTKDVGKALELGGQMAKFVTDTLFSRPMELAFEKIYFPYLLLSRKRYAGLYHTAVGGHDKLDVKGLELARRDNCPLTRETQERVLSIILEERNPLGALEYAKGVISDLVNNRTDISKLIITKELRREPEMYKTPSPHSALVQRIRERDKTASIVVGMRVPFVFVRRPGQKGSGRACDMAEDPSFAVANKLPIDSTYYIEHQILEPLCRVLGHLVPDVKRVLTTGEHMAPPRQQTLRRCWGAATDNMEGSQSSAASTGRREIAAAGTSRRQTSRGVGAAPE